MATGLDDARAVARETFGYDALHPGQDEALVAVLAGRDTLAVMPTGFGKSAIYQIAGVLIPGPTVVVSPLVALQRDQVESLAERGLAAAELNSHVPASRRAEALAALRKAGSSSSSWRPSSSRTTTSGRRSPPRSRASSWSTRRTA